MPARHATNHPGTPPSRSRALRLAPARAAWLPVSVALALLVFLLFESIRQAPGLAWSFVGGSAALLVWAAVVFTSAARRRRVLTLQIALRKQHYIQACAQGSVLLYWGWYWPQAQDWAPLIVAQLLFAYGVDMLVTWSKGDTYMLGFNPFPVIFSINLFLWFKPAWFYLQFLMVALGFIAKHVIRWDREGRRVHIFNPSAFPLAVFSLALLATGTTGITWGPEIAITQFYPPNMYLMLFLIGLPGQYFFGVTSMTMSAVVATYVFGLAYYAATGVYFFYDSYIPIAVFLGMHLLFTDPSTSPRSELGRIIFGALYGLSTIALYALLAHGGAPTFYDKLLQVPLLNLSIGAIDRLARSKALRAVDPAVLGRSLLPRQRNIAYISIWTIVFAVMTAAGAVGDRHPGQWLPFWQEACAEGRPGACAFEAARLSTHCEEGSAWACNEAGRFERGCELGLAAACGNVLTLVSGTGAPRSVAPTLADYPIILRGSKTAITDRSPSALYALACEQGWPDTCDIQDAGTASK